MANLRTEIYGKVMSNIDHTLRVNGDVFDEIWDRTQNRINNIIIGNIEIAISMQLGEEIPEEFIIGDTDMERKCRRKNLITNEFEIIEFKDLKPGDIFTFLESNDEHIVSSIPYINKDNLLAVDVEGIE